MNDNARPDALTAQADHLERAVAMLRRSAERGTPPDARELLKLIAIAAPFHVWVKGQLAAIIRESEDEDEADKMPPATGSGALGSSKFL